MKSNLNIIGIDTETGGLKPGVHSLLQLALVAYKKGEIVDKLDLFVREDEYVVTPKAMEINGLQLNYVYDYGIRPAEVLEKVTGFVKRNFSDELPILLGHNLGLDRNMLKHLFEDHGKNMDMYISHRNIDTMSILWVLHDLGYIPKEACSSFGAFEYFGIEIDKAHDALSDIMATIKLYDKLKNLIAA